MSTKTETEEKVFPRLTESLIDHAIVGEEFHVFSGTSLTVCMLTLRNGYSVIGESASLSIENFDKKIGEDIARADAREKVWSLEGYLLKEIIFQQKETAKKTKKDES